LDISTLGVLSQDKVDSALQMAKALQNVTNQSIPAQTVHHHLKSKGMRAVVKRKRPLLKPHHRRARWNLLRGIWSGVLSGVLRIGRRSDGLMSAELIVWGQRCVLPHFFSRFISY
jgi:hypothetical protein